MNATPGDELPSSMANLTIRIEVIVPVDPTEDGQPSGQAEMTIYTEAFLPDLPQPSRLAVLTIELRQVEGPVPPATV